MKLKFKSATELEVMAIGRHGGSNVNAFPKGHVIDVVATEGEFPDYFDLTLSDGRRIIGVAKNLFTVVKEKAIKPSIVSLPTHYIFLAVQVHNPEGCRTRFDITISTFSKEDAMVRAGILERALGGIKLELIHPK
jgi:hypothetical protein